jgi:DNA-binding winged helix-turn-helix (wHTH) protein
LLDRGPAMSPAGPHDYEFAPFRLEGMERRPFCSGNPIALTEKVFDLLLFLVQQRGRALSKAELMRQLWPDRHRRSTARNAPTSTRLTWPSSRA